MKDILLTPDPKLSISKKLDHFMSLFPNITKHESDFISSILQWEDETKMAFLMAKQLFEEEEK